MRYGVWSNPGASHRIYTHLSEKDTQKWNDFIRAFYDGIEAKSETSFNAVSR